MLALSISCYRALTCCRSLTAFPWCLLWRGDCPGLGHFPITPNGTRWGGLYWTHATCSVSPAQNPTPPWDRLGSSFKPSFSVCTLPVALGNIQAVALRDIFVQAQNRDSSPPSLQIEEPEWEKRRSVNLSELIDVYRYGWALSLAIGRPSGDSCTMESLSLGWPVTKVWGISTLKYQLLPDLFNTEKFSSLGRGMLGVCISDQGVLHNWITRMDINLQV